MPKSTSDIKKHKKPRSHPLLAKQKLQKAKKPQVQVTYEDGSTPAQRMAASNKKDLKGKAKATEQVADEMNEEQDNISIGSDAEDEDIKPIIKEEDGVFQQAYEQSIAASGQTSDTSGPSFIIIAGSYEKNLYGIEGTFVTNIDNDSEEPVLQLAPSFIFPAHLSCIKSLSVSEGAKWLVTGSDDEFIKVWDLRRRKEVGSLSQHVGTITSLTFPSPSHLLSTSEDSTITVFRTRDWVPLRTLKGHSGKVNCVDVHPSGKVALSVGKDQTLRMWDLMRGRGASSLGLGFEAELVRFSSSGKIFAILGYEGIDLYTINMKKIAHLTHPKRKRLHDIRFASVTNAKETTNLLLTGTEDGKVLAWKMDEALAIQMGASSDDTSDTELEDAEVCSLVAVFGGHSNRVKAVDFLVTKRPAPFNPLPIIVTVSSDGKMNVYNALSAIAPQGLASTTTPESEIQPIASYSTSGSRLVCCRVAEVTKPKTQVSRLPLPETKVRVKVEDVKKEEAAEEDDDEDSSEHGGLGEEEEEEEEEEEVEDEVEEE